MAIDVEFVEHEVLGRKVHFALDRQNHDWYFEQVRKKPFRNPVHHHLPKLRQLLAGKPMKYADFGANIGTTSYFAAAMGVQTLAVEAGSVNFVLLLEAHRKNGFGKLFRPVYIAAADRPEVVSFSENSAWGAISGEGKQTSRVPTASIAQILDMHDFADAAMLKIDIEGAELRALEGFETIAAVEAPDLIVESNEIACMRFGYTPQRLWGRMIELGYDVYMLSGTRLVSVDGASAQTGIVEDVLATRRTPAELESRFGYVVTPYDASAARQALVTLREKFPNDQKHLDFVSRQMAVLDH